MQAALRVQPTGHDLTGGHNPLLTDYVVFINDDGAVVFVMEKQRAIWFRISEDSIIIGDGGNRNVFANVPLQILDIVRDRRAILVMEAENQKIVRATPCNYAGDIVTDRDRVEDLALE